MEENITPLKTGIKYGGYLGMAMIVITLVEHYAGWQNFEDLNARSNYYSDVLSLAIGFAITFTGIKYYRTQSEGLLTFGEGMSVALFTGIFSGIIGALFMYIFAAYIAPDLGEAVMNTIDLDEMSDDEAEAVEQVMGFASSPTFLAFASFITSLILGVIYGLIGSLILKKG